MYGFVDCLPIQASSLSAWRRVFPQGACGAGTGYGGAVRDQHAPDGARWQPLSPNTLRRSVQQAIRKVGGRAARPIVRTTARGGLIVRARHPQPGFQRTARVRRTRQSKILVDTGRLRNSVVAIAASADAVRQRNRLTLIWGTRVPYARAHQFGNPSRNLPARPFLGVSQPAYQRLVRELNGIIQQYASGG
jgi:phage gpG-like protein